MNLQKRLSKLLLFFTLCLSFMYSVYAEELSLSTEEKKAIDYLNSLDIEDLVNVEVVLDDVFNVFDGLIKARKTTVASGVEQSTSRAPSVTTVITAQDIEAMGATDIDEVLEAVPGLHVRVDAIRYKPVYTIRGLSSMQNPEVLMMINGVPLNNFYLGNRSGAWGGMPVNAISRIEVVRGPGSAVYGANAYSGVINIVTKTKDEIKGTEVGMRASSFNTQDAWLLHGGKWGNFDVALALEYHDTEGFREMIEADAQTSYDKAFKTDVSFAPGPVNMQRRNFDTRVDISRGNWQLRAGYQGRHHQGSGAGIAQSLDPQGRYTDDRLNADLTYHNPQLTEKWDVTTQVSYLQTQWKPENNQLLFPPGAFGGTYPEGYIGNPGLSETNTRFETFGFYSGFNQHVIRLGVGYHYADVYKVLSTANFGIDPATGKPLPPGGPVIDLADTSAVWLPEKSRSDWGVSLQDIWTLSPQWELTAGVRHDRYSDFGSTTNPRFALVWQPIPSLTGKLLYGQAFRAPSLNDQFSASNPSQLGNPNLKPETVKTWEFATDYRATQNLHLAFNVFSYRATDKIQFGTNPDTTPGAPPLLAQNIGSQEGKGLEFEARWKPTIVSSVLFNYSFQEATNENNHDVGFDPQQLVYLRTDWLLIPNWFLDVKANWVADRKRTYGDPREPVDNYLTVDLTLRRKDVSNNRWGFALGIRNLFDDEVHEPSLGPNARGMIAIPNDLPLAGRNYFLELRYQF